ncbi:hypothetical protein [Desertimonas flava]|uniref:hypothetical protein n=1 Tax=Desertimonas flava TaxID=2064846 RepID=UPI000E357DB4|nr:hypothetical protein [Desertimonas flava]
MTSTVTVAMGDLVDRALQEIQAYNEVGRAVVRTEAWGPTDTTCTLSSPESVNVSDVIEFGNELVLVSGKSSDPTPIFTVSRGYYGTTAQSHNSNDPGLVNPQWNRQRVAGAVKRSFARMEALGIRLVLTETLAAISDPGATVESWPRQILEVPAGTRSVLSVKQDLYEIPNWEFLGNVDSTIHTSGRIVRMPRGVAEGDEFQVTYRMPYRWSSHPDEPTEAATIQIPEGAEDVPPAYAAAWLSSRREISRMEIDRLTEWQQGEAQRGGVSTSAQRALWQEVYRLIDEASRLEPEPNRRPLVRRARR